MSLGLGSRLAHYDVTALIGEGGMGQVYQATDTKLNRQVALKILPEAFATDPDRLARFQREAQVLASLNHPGIAAIHGIEESEDTRALVLELVEGPTLADRIAQGPIPVDEALPIAKQIAEALEAAHEAGVIHRDLKPANIKLKPNGTVKVLDFGLAKAFPTDEGDSILSDASAVTVAATEAGVILGTVGYMSPEQARGQPSDKRADVWAFGCVFYEMLSGRRTFRGDSQADILAAVLDQEPDWEALRAVAPEWTVGLVLRCLRKDRARRLRDLGDAALEIDDVALGSDAAGEAVSRRRRGARTWLVGAPALVAGLVLAYVLWTGIGSSPARLPVTRLSLPLPAGQQIVQLERSYPLALSSDGAWLAYVADVDGERQLFVRALDQFQSRPVDGTTGARYPFFSPDGRWIGFFADGQLFRVAVAGGPPLAVCAAIPGLGAAWGENGRVTLDHRAAV